MKIIKNSRFSNLRSKKKSHGGNNAVLYERQVVEK
jgi:hypothetical protein